MKSGIDDWKTPEGKQIIRMQIVDCLLEILRKNKEVDLSIAIKAAELIGKAVGLWNDVEETDDLPAIQQSFLS